MLCLLASPDMGWRCRCQATRHAHTAPWCLLSIISAGFVLDRLLAMRVALTGGLDQLCRWLGVDPDMIALGLQCGDLPCQYSSIVFVSVRVYGGCRWMPVAL